VERVVDDAVRGPQAMREATRSYVRTMHAAYLDHVRHLSPGERGTLPLVAAGGFTVAAAATQRLHLVATPERLPAPQGREVEIVDEYCGAGWRLRFFDPTVLPELGLLAANDRPDHVRRVLGVTDTVYHLTISLRALTGHHAQHSGVALANSHTTTGRNLERLRRALPHRASDVDELAACVRLGLNRAAALLAADLTAGRVKPGHDEPARKCLDAVLADVVR
jgi:hypothetical protein